MIPRSHLAFLASLALLATVIGVALAQDGGVWDHVTNVSDRPGLSGQATTAFDSVTRNLWVVWREEETGSLGEIVARRWNEDTCTWSPDLSVPPEDLSASPWFDGGPGIIFDDQGTGLLLWTRRECVVDGAVADVSEVMWRAWSGGSWSEAQSLFQVDTCLPTSYGYRLIPILTPSAIRLYIVWGHGYRMAEYEQGTWTPISGPTYLVFPGEVFPELADVVRGPDGVIHAAAYAKNSRVVGYDEWFRDAYYLRYEEDTWSTPINLSYTDGVAGDVALDFDAAGGLHFLWSDPDSVYSSESLKSTIWERILDNGTWSPNQEILPYNAGQAIDGFALTRGPTGTLHLAWSEGVFEGNAHADLDLRYQAGDGTTWGPEATVYTSTLATRYPVLSRQAGTPAIVWEEGSLAERDVYVAHNCREVAPNREIYLPLVIALPQ